MVAQLHTSGTFVRDGMLFTTCCVLQQWGAWYKAGGTYQQLQAKRESLRQGEGVRNFPGDSAIISLSLQLSPFSGYTYPFDFHHRQQQGKPKVFPADREEQFECVSAFLKEQPNALVSPRMSQFVAS